MADTAHRIVRLEPPRRPERVIELAVKGMLPKTKLGRAMAKKLKVYADAEHPHAAQQPTTFELPSRKSQK